MTKPESETDPWKAIQRYEFVQTNFAYTTDHEMERDAEGEWARWEAVDAARAAEAAQHRQEIAAKDAQIQDLQSGRWRTYRNSCPRTFTDIPMTPDECSCVDCVEIRNARELVQLRAAISTIDAQIHQQAELLAQRWDTIERLSHRLAAVEAERDRLQRVNECVYEVCGCGNMADAHCMICCRPLTEHRLIPTRELAEIQRRFAFYAEDAAERDRLKAALQDVTIGMDRAGGDRDGMPECPWCQSQGRPEDAEEGYAHDVDCSLMMARAALTTQGQSTDGETR